MRVLITGLIVFAVLAAVLVGVWMNDGLETSDSQRSDQSVEADPTRLTRRNAGDEPASEANARESGKPEKETGSGKTSTLKGNLTDEMPEETEIDRLSELTDPASGKVITGTDEKSALETDAEGDSSNTDLERICEAIRKNLGTPDEATFHDVRSAFERIEALEGTITRRVYAADALPMRWSGLIFPSEDHVGRADGQDVNTIVKGVVVAEDGRPIKGAIVTSSLAFDRAITDQSGAFSLHTRDRRERLTIYADGFEERSLSLVDHRNRTETRSKEISGANESVLKEPLVMEVQPFIEVEVTPENDGYMVGMVETVRLLFTSGDRDWRGMRDDLIDIEVRPARDGKVRLRLPARGSAAGWSMSGFGRNVVVSLGDRDERKLQDAGSRAYANQQKMLRLEAVVHFVTTWRLHGRIEPLLPEGKTYLRESLDFQGCVMKLARASSSSILAMIASDGSFDIWAPDEEFMLSNLLISIEGPRTKRPAFKFETAGESSGVNANSMGGEWEVALHVSHSVWASGSVDVRMLKTKDDAVWAYALSSAHYLQGNADRPAIVMHAKRNVETNERGEPVREKDKRFAFAFRGYVPLSTSKLVCGGKGLEAPENEAGWRIYTDVIDLNAELINSLSFGSYYPPREKSVIGEDK